MTTIGVFASIFDEQGRILLAKRNYGPRNWTTPGGQLESSESHLDGLMREVREETGYIVQPVRLIGAYSTPHNDDLVLSFEAEIVEPANWQPNDEISQVEFFSRSDLPRPMHFRAFTCIQDAYEGKSGVMQVFGPESEFEYK